MILIVGFIVAAVLRSLTMTDKPNNLFINQPQRGTQSIHRAISLVRLIADQNNQGMRLSSISYQLGLHPATAHRILASLLTEGLITQNPISKLYHLGLELFVWGTKAHHFSIRDNARGTLEKIARETEDTVFLMVRSGNDALCIDRVEGTFPIRTLTHEVGTRAPLGIGAGSSALLASLPDNHVEVIIKANRPRYADYNNRTPDDIRALVKLVRKLGYGISEGNVMPGAVAVGASVRNPEKEVIAAISVSAISRRMDRNRREKVVQLIKKESKALEHSISEVEKHRSKSG